MPPKVGVFTLVTLSVLERPESLAAFSTGTEGTVGAVVSTTTTDPAEETEVLPARSVARAVMVWGADVSALVAMV